MVRVCLFQCGGSGTPIENVGMLLSALESAERSGAQIVLFPELFIHGYCIGPQFAELAEPRDGPIFQAVSVAAQKHNVCVVYGYAESATEDASEIRRIFNSVQVVDKNGISVINYRKTHLWGEYEKLHFFPGKCLPPVVEIEGFKLSVLICYDIEFPEPARILAAKGAQLILVPTACTAVDAHLMIPVRAMENHLFVAYCNRVGPEGSEIFSGESLICGPDGSTLYRASSRDMDFRVLDLNFDKPSYKTAMWKNGYLQDRRPELYGEIALQTRLARRTVEPQPHK